MAPLASYARPVSGDLRVLLPILSMPEVGALIAVEEHGITPAERVRYLVREYLSLKTGDLRFENSPLREVER